MDDYVPALVAAKSATQDAGFRSGSIRTSTEKYDQPAVPSRPLEPDVAADYDALHVVGSSKPIFGIGERRLPVADRSGPASVDQIRSVREGAARKGDGEEPGHGDVSRPGARFGDSPHHTESMPLSSKWPSRRPTTRTPASGAAAASVRDAMFRYEDPIGFPCS